MSQGKANFQVFQQTESEVKSKLQAHCKAFEASRQSSRSPWCCNRVRSSWRVVEVSGLRACSRRCPSSSRSLQRLQRSQVFEHCGRLWARKAGWGQRCPGGYWNSCFAVHSAGLAVWYHPISHLMSNTLGLTGAGTVLTKGRDDR